VVFGRPVICSDEEPSMFISTLFVSVNRRLLQMI